MRGERLESGIWSRLKDWSWEESLKSDENGVGRRLELEGESREEMQEEMRSKA